VVSGIFTGCYMSFYTIAGQRRVAHVHTGDDGAPCCKAFFGDLVKKPTYKLLGNFKPYAGDRDLDRCSATALASQFGASGAPVFGIIEPNNRCHSVFLKKLGPFHFVVEDTIEQQPTLALL
jgi:hypothetical protein